MLGAGKQLVPHERHCRSKLLRGRAVDPQDVIRKIEAVTKEDVERAAHEMFSKPFSASAVGRNVEGLKLM